MWKVYILKSINKDWFYIGCTNDIERRLTEHNRGYSASTYWHRPFEIVHSESYQNRSDAYAREKVLKSYKSGNGLRKILDK